MFRATSRAEARVFVVEYSTPLAVNAVRGRRMRRRRDHARGEAIGCAHEADAHRVADATPAAVTPLADLDQDLVALARPLGHGVVALVEWATR